MGFVSLVYVTKANIDLTKPIFQAPQTLLMTKNAFYLINKTARDPFFVNVNQPGFDKRDEVSSLSLSLKLGPLSKNRGQG